MIRLLGAMLLLATLDATAALFLKEAVQHRNPLFAVYGIVLMVAVAGVLMWTLELAELTIVSLGWIILFQVAVMVIDRYRYDVVPGRVQLIAIIVAVIALAVAALAPNAAQEQQAKTHEGKHSEGPPTVMARIPQQRSATDELTGKHLTHDKPWQY